MKFLLKLFVRHVINSVVNPGDVEQFEREDAYIALFNNKKMMKVLKKMIVEDTKEMMIKDCHSGDFMRGARWGMFMRAKAIHDKAEEYAKKAAKEKPDAV